MGFDHVETMVGGHYAGLGWMQTFLPLLMHIIMKGGFILEGWAIKETKNIEQNYRLI